MNIINDETQPSLCAEYLNILNLSDDALNDSCFDELIETVEDWFVDWCKLSLNGSFYHNELPKLKLLLKDCHIDEVEQILSLHNTGVENSIEY